MIRSLKTRLKYIAIKAARPFQRLMSAAERDIASEKVENLKKKFQSAGTHVKISSSAIIICPTGVVVGNNVHVDDDCYINAEGGLQIQDNVHISRRVTIYASDHVFRNSGLLPYGPFREWRQTIIEKNVWIGMNVCILPGVRIGEGSIIGMGSIVAKDAPPLSIIGQSPYRSIGSRDVKEYAIVDASGHFGGRDGRSAEAERRPPPLPSGRASRPNITFVLTTGRSGSTSIVDVFNRNSEVEARHEPRLQLVQWSTQLAHGEISRDETLKLLDELYLKTSVYQEGKIYLESDQKYFNLVPLLKELLPSSKFIWLTRNGRDVVSSATGRGWYSDEKHPVYRKIPYYFHRYRVSGDLCGQIDSKKWKEMGSFERNCWYWAYVNSTIRKNLSSLPETDWIHVRLEELSNETQRISEHIGVSGSSLAKAHSNAAFYPIYKTSTWSAKEEAFFEQWCGHEMEYIYGKFSPIAR